MIDVCHRYTIFSIIIQLQQLLIILCILHSFSHSHSLLLSLCASLSTYLSCFELTNVDFCYLVRVLNVKRKNTTFAYFVILVNKDLSFSLRRERETMSVAVFKYSLSPNFVWENRPEYFLFSPSGGSDKQTKYPLVWYLLILCSSARKNSNDDKLLINIAGNEKRVCKCRCLATAVWYDMSCPVLIDFNLIEIFVISVSHLSLPSPLSLSYLFIFSRVCLVLLPSADWNLILTAVLNPCSCLYTVWEECTKWTKFY